MNDQKEADTNYLLIFFNEVKINKLNKIIIKLSKDKTYEL